MAVRSTQSPNRAVRSTQGGRGVSPSYMLKVSSFIGAFYLHTLFNMHSNVHSLHTVYIFHKDLLVVQKMESRII